MDTPAPSKDVYQGIEFLPDSDDDLSFAVVAGQRTKILEWLLGKTPPFKVKRIIMGRGSGGLTFYYTGLNDITIALRLRKKMFEGQSGIFNCGKSRANIAKAAHEWVKDYNDPNFSSLENSRRDEVANRKLDGDGTGEIYVGDHPHSRRKLMEYIDKQTSGKTKYVSTVVVESPIDKLLKELEYQYNVLANARDTYERYKDDWPSIGKRWRDEEIPKHLAKIAALEAEIEKQT